MQLTPNRRLATYLTEQAQGKEAYPFSEWIETLWENYPARSAALLNPVAQQIVWERVIRNGSESYPLLNIAPTTRMAMDAWALCHQWGISLNAVDWQTEDHRSFLSWAKQFQEICQTNQWIDGPRLLSTLSFALQNESLPLPSKIDCIGFQEWDPQQTQFLTLCQHQGVKVAERSLLKEKGETFQLAASSFEEELNLAFIYAEGVLSENPNARLGIVIPDLEQRRFEVLGCLEDHFHPNQYNISAPISLAEYPLVDAALLALRLFEKDLLFEEWSQFLRSPFFGQSLSEMAYRAQLDVLFREASHSKTYSIEGFFSIVSGLINKLPGFLSGSFTELQCIKGLRALLECKFTTRSRRSADQWADFFVEMLSKLGWPGERRLNSLEYQLKKQWDEVLEEYRNLSYLLGRHYYSEALNEVQRLCRLKRFLPSSTSKTASIQVLGLLEALGLPFDHLWIVGFHREAWPKEPAPNPFIPFSLQRTLNLPRSSPKREFQVAVQITEQLFRGAGKVIFSYPQRVQDNKTAISSLLTSLPVLPFQRPATLASRSLTSNLINKQRNLSLQIIDFREPALPLQPDEKFSQGSRLLKLQSLCPFRAFAEIRLKARPLGREQWGLNPAERGDILHRILNVFWQTLEGQRDLILLGEGGREDRLQVAVETVFKQWERDHRYRLQPRYFTLEKQRTVRLIRQFIALELSRPPFKVIAHESEHAVVLNGVPLKLRIDRIDQLETGEEILMDYKTGKIHVADWFGERPLDPQLPLYCIARSPRPQGVAFALLQSPNIQYQGLAVVQGALPGVLSAKQLARYGCADSLEEQLGLWQKQLEALANEFMVGRAEVEPVEGEKTCRRCHLRPLCRVGSALLAGEP